MFEGGNYHSKSLSVTVVHERVDIIESKEVREKKFAQRLYSDRKKSSSSSTCNGSHNTTIAQSDGDTKEVPISPISSDYAILDWRKSSDIDEDQLVYKDFSDVEDEDGYLLKP